MQCKQDKQDASRYLSDLMDARERLDYEAHLDECAECREELARYRRLLVMLGEMPVEKAPLGLSRALDEAANKHFGGGKRTKPLYARRPAILRVAAAAVLVGAIVVVAYFAFNPNTEMLPVPGTDKIAKTDHTKKADPVRDDTAVGGIEKESLDKDILSPKKNTDSLRVAPSPGCIGKNAENAVSPKIVVETELDKPAEGYSKEQMLVILDNAAKIQQEDLLAFYAIRVNSSSNIIAAYRTSGNNVASHTALQAAERAARLKRLYAAAAKQVQTNEQVEKLQKATENLQQQITVQNAQILEQQNVSSKKQIHCFGAGGKDDAASGAGLDMEALKKREKELIAALAIMNSIDSKTGGEKLPSGSEGGGDKKSETEKEAFEIAKRAAIERELAAVREQIKALEQKSKAVLGKAKSSDPTPKAVPKDGRSDANESGENENEGVGDIAPSNEKPAAPKSAAKKPVPEISVSPIFRQTLIVQFAAGDLSDEKAAKIAGAIEKLRADKAKALLVGQTVELKLTDEEIAKLLGDLSRVGAITLTLGPLEASFDAKPVQVDKGRKSEDAVAEAPDTELRTILSLCLIRAVKQAP